MCELPPDFANREAPNPHFDKVEGVDAPYHAVIGLSWVVRGAFVVWNPNSGQTTPLPVVTSKAAPAGSSGRPTSLLYTVVRI